MTDATTSGPMMAADGRPLKSSLNRALRRQKIRALLLIAPLLLFIMITFIVPIGQMLFRSVENNIVADTLPRTVAALASWEVEQSDVPDQDTFRALAQDMVVAVEKKDHTRLGSRLNYELTGVSSLFRKSGRAVDEFGETAQEQFEDIDPAFAEPAAWVNTFGSDTWADRLAEWSAGGEEGRVPAFAADADIRAVLPETTSIYADFVRFVASEGDNPAEEDVWPIIYHTLAVELSNADLTGLQPALPLAEVQGVSADFELEDLRAAFADVDEDWLSTDVWETIQTYSGPYTSGYFLTSVDRQLTPDGVELRAEDERIYLTLFLRTMIMSVVITVSCILLGYPVAWLLANLPMRTANVLMILVLLPFWTSLLVRTSAWKALLQNQGVINDLLVWIGIVADDNRLALINNATGTIIAMTHILLPFMILPLYSVMKTIPPSYLRAAKSLGATNFTAFWRVYFPQSVPGIGAGSILVFILSIGYYITPEIVGGTKGVFISNRIAYHISTSLNWGLAAALGSILLALVLIFYWLYDRIVGIDNVKLGG
ncbi:putative spermidine/putrescine transport system permease protein [Cognatiyoonia koreensis]|uniref:Putative spermidine/putrescine transport system permease protein n=1 Tax=Cognatiyoonia koreensis TaxID=364200 RepID=A0A1I0NG69_9RHOB|nr:ABC transporter permease [Cognatiyoonia koreensis]SEW00479.1 putative spermidine/putrescine transport system permease protein [Cognatiyoonia koreensis]